MRYLIYVAGTLLLFCVAVGVGAAAAFVISRQPEQVAGDSGGPTQSGTLEDTLLDTTGSAKALERTASEPPSNPKNANPRKPADEASFVHRATAENSSGDYTYISDSSINGDANAIVLVAPTRDQGNARGTTYAHNIGVWYEPVAKKWAIFNQDRTAVPSGAAFEVVVPLASQSFVHHAEPDNTAGNITYLDDPLTNGRPDAVLSVTQDWNPGGGGGVYNNHPIDVVYDKRVEKWAIYNQDSTLIPNGAAFNVAVSGDGDPTR